MHPNNLVMTLMGVGLLWVGWFGFNAGSSLNSSFVTARALTATQVAAASGALGWIVIESIHVGKATSLGLASGILAGLVAITPAAGAVPPGGAMALGALASLICYLAILFKNRVGYDDSLDVFGIHGMAGMAGAILLTFFAREGGLRTASVASQFGVQLAGVAVTIVYAAVVSLLLLVLVESTLGLRLPAEQEMAGMDHTLHREHGYGLLNLN